ncbi:hypothetical protein QWY85_07975 [Neolewinella lacunae]|uniref:Uncharacterized protein n=1 Tax=Neolewinella lacunae TaxID=1517758 RepID=A0A923PIE2_9BACT|nr:hypothetical protein [Neolewinella lacunae]MBC6994718.1 hypothetical protein [Neolewinella lacunae]MDN3634590.1 hypothetical protein [Neolewinella lacunae]
MSLSTISRFIILLALVMIALAGFFPSPLMIGLAATSSALLVLSQTYVILRDDQATAANETEGPYAGYSQK